MGGKVLIIDTSVMCVWLRVPGKETAGKGGVVTYEYVSRYIDEQTRNGATLVLPMTTIIETGNFIAQVEHGRKEVARRFADMIVEAADGKQPWAVFSRQKDLWDGGKLKDLANRWSETVVVEKQSLGDAAIVDVAAFYKELGCTIEIFTGDGGLKNWEQKVSGQPKLSVSRGRRRNR